MVTKIYRVLVDESDNSVAVARVSYSGTAQAYNVFEGEEADKILKLFDELEPSLQPLRLSDFIIK